MAGPLGTCWYSQVVHVKPPVLVAGKPILTEAGVACQGNAGEQPQTVT